MKYTLLIVSFLFIGFGFTQKHIAPYTGSYHLDVDATNQIMIKKGMAAQGQEIPTEVRKQMESITLDIQKNKMAMNMMGRVKEIKFSDRASSLKDGACDLVLILDKENAIDGAQEKFLTLISLENGKIQLVSVDRNQDMDNFIWTRIE